MAEENKTDSSNPQGQGAAAGQFMLQRIYLKDLSFEAPLGVAAFNKAWKPKISQDLNTSVNRVDEDHYEVVLKLTISAVQDDKTAFLVEVQQAGIFAMKGIEGAQLAQITNTICPQILFPYAREVIDSSVVKGGFPALALPPINFDALFVRAVQQQQSQQAGDNSVAEATN